MIELLQHGLVDADGRIEAMDGARAVVEKVGDRVELFLAVNRQVRTFAQVLANQPVARTCLSSRRFALNRFIVVDFLQSCNIMNFDKSKFYVAG